MSGSNATTDAAGVDHKEPLYKKLNTDRKKVAYFYDSDIGSFAYNTGHPMKPHRIRLAHSLVMNYGVYKFMEVYRAKPAVFNEMTQFHTDEYIDFLQRVTPENMEQFQREQTKFNVGDDCPVFEGLFEFCGISAGGSMEGAARLNRSKCDIAINWAGGLHHAKKSEASGFCYVNDIVLAILELLRFNKRVLYIDIDVHHGDGVEEAFYTTDRVMTVSFHKYGEYFPGTGELRDIGIGLGKNYSVNFPLRDGINDESYTSIFESVIDAVMKYYAPEAVVLQCGGDSLSGDRLGCFNLSMRGHANCVSFVRKYNLPTLILGGGGYTMRNVSRTWAFETGLAVGLEMQKVLPFNEYYDYYAPDFELDVRPSNMENANNKDYLEKIKIALLENLKKTAPVPSVQLQDIPNGMAMTDEEEAELADLDEDENPDVRMTELRADKRTARDDEFEDSDDEDGGQTNGKPNRPPRRSIMEPDPKLDQYRDQEDEEGRPLDVEMKDQEPAEPEVAEAPAAVAAEEVTMEDAAPLVTAPAAAEAENNVADQDGDVAMDDAAAEDKDDEAPVKKEPEDDQPRPSEAAAKEPTPKPAEPSNGAETDNKAEAKPVDKEASPKQADKDAEPSAPEPTSTIQTAAADPAESSKDKDAEAAPAS